ncbi:hypothetical protein PYW07_002760 [Mythimna separata]|uniref:FP protein C-terminal domain-containing protein n=1 Tax=Mythimna separata TaxID=271217 RepID=A0AAD8DQR0_MYTSE|nr:hypothetical protein PYW07_002760 [Mythimna separata]
MQRTPPKTGLSQGQSVSEPDIPTATAGKADAVNITTRNKRQRLADSPNKEEWSEQSGPFSAFKLELMDMLTTWKSEQEKLLRSWKDEQAVILSNLVRDVTELKRKCLSIEKSNAEIDNSMSFINEKFESLNSKVSLLEKERIDHQDHINHLKKQVQDLNFLSRQATIEVRNIPMNEKETPTDLISAVSSIGKTVNMEVGQSAFRDVYRIPGKAGLCRPIVAEFSCVNKRNEFLAKVRKFNKERSVNDKLNTQLIGIAGEKKPVYIDEHMPPATKKLLYDVRQFAKARSYSSWYSNGRILLKKDPTDKPVEIKSDKCLSMLAIPVPVPAPERVKQ